MITLVSILISLVAAFLLGKSHFWRPADPAAISLKELASQDLYQQAQVTLQDLEEDFNSGKVNAPDYQELRASAVTELEGLTTKHK